MQTLKASLGDEHKRKEEKYLFCPLEIVVGAYEEKSVSSDRN